MIGLNKVILIGTAGKNPETQYIKKGFSKTSFTLATDCLNTLPDGRKVSVTEWHDVCVYGELSEYALQYLKKGDSIFVEGSLKTRYVTSESGYRYKITEIEGEKIQIIARSQKNSQTPVPETVEEKIGSAIPGFDMENIPAAQIKGEIADIPF